MTNILNLLEVEYALLRRDVHPDEISKAMAPVEMRAVGIDRLLMRRAAGVRADMRANGFRCSYIDAVGYAQAQELGLPFLTGDGAFRRMAGVRFLVGTSA